MSNRNRRKLTGKVARTAVRSTARGVPRAAVRGVVPQNTSRGRGRRHRAPRGILLSVLGWLWAGLTAFVLIMYAINTDELNPIVFGVIFLGSIILFIVLTTPLRRRRRNRQMQHMQSDFVPQVIPPTQPDIPNMDEIATSLHGFLDKATKRLADAAGIPVDKQETSTPDAPPILDTCPSCAAPNSNATTICEYCGVKLN